MNNYKISIIVPVYNVESYISDCLQSLVKQTYKNLEILCVDDGSTDRSGIICDEFAANDSRIKVFHTKNQGAGAARNIGLDNVTGQYVGFVDGDDFIDIEMYEQMFKLIIQHDGDAVSCDFTDFYRSDIGNIKTIDDNSADIEILTGTEFLRKTVEHWKYYTMCNKLFIKDCIGNVRFPVGNIIDDGFFTYKIMGGLNRVILYKKPLYFYRRRKSSVMNKKDYRVLRNRQLLELHKARLEYISIHYPELTETFQKKMCEEYSVIIRGNAIEKNDEKNAIRFMRKNCDKALFRLFRFKESIWYLLFMYLPMWREKSKHEFQNRINSNSVKEEDLFD